MGTTRGGALPAVTMQHRPATTPAMPRGLSAIALMPEIRITARLTMAQDPSERIAR